MKSSNTSNEAEKGCDGSCDSCDERGSCDDPRAREATDRMARIRYKILVGSGKGGVGKSTVTVNLAVALKHRGYKVGILDADITGPNIPKLLGIEDQHLASGLDGIEPADAGGIKAVSMALVLENRDSAVVWRGPMKMAAIKQFLSSVNWGDLDFLLIDLPPGTSDEPLSVVQLIPGLDGAIIVTTPQEVALLDSRKAVNMFQMMKVPLLGIIENMSGLACPHCGKVIDVFKRGGAEKAARELGVNFLGAIPLDAEIGTLGDQGVAFTGQGTAAGCAFEKIVSRIMERLVKSQAIEEVSKVVK
jgi:ATP-binding protein involved in chromosome partitioning